MISKFLITRSTSISMFLPLSLFSSMILVISAMVPAILRNASSVWHCRPSISLWCLGRPPPQKVRLPPTISLPRKPADIVEANYRAAPRLTRMGSVTCSPILRGAARGLDEIY